MPDTSPPLRVHVLLFDPGSDQEGIHSIELGARTVVLLFEDPDDAERYAGLLEAQDFPVPCVEAVDRREIELFCDEAGYEARLVPIGFRPGSDEEKLMLAPPQRNLDVSNWREQGDEDSSDDAGPDDEVDDELVIADPEMAAFRRRLEGLL